MCAKVLSGRALLIAAICENTVVMIWWRRLLVLFATVVWSGSLALGGGSGLNAVVVINQASSNSVAAGNYYCERRRVPPQNVLRIAWAGGNVEWSLQQFDQVLSTPLRAMLAARKLTGQVEFVVLSMDIPYRVRNGTSRNSTTSALFYGFKSDGAMSSCALPSAAASPYAAIESPLREVPNAPTFANALLTTMITASNLASVKSIVDQGVLSDIAPPAQEVTLAKSPDRLRNIRYLRFDDAVMDLRLLGAPAANRVDCADPSALGYIAGYQNGMASFNLGLTRFSPGAIADDFTSYGGLIFEPNDQTTCLAFLEAGACGTYGTVVEPCAHYEKFPSPRVFFYQGRGFSLAEAYYQSISHPYQGLMLGDPLAAPFARPGAAQWQNLPENALLRGITNLTLDFSSPRKISRVDLFLDGTFLQTVTNVAPQPGNLLQVALPGREITYRVPVGASLRTVAQGLASEAEKFQNLTGVRAFAVGDRIQLQSISRGRKGASTQLGASASAGTASFQTTFLQASGPEFLDTTARGLRTYTVTNLLSLGDWLQMIIIRTNGAVTSIGLTNTIPGTTLAEFTKLLLERASDHSQLNGADGITIQDVNMHEDYPFNVYIYGTNDHSGAFNVVAGSPGWDAAQVKVCLRGSARMGISPSGTNTLEQNLDDLQPRAHLYLSAGLSSLKSTATVDTRSIADGTHELTAVGYEGTHARTQTRVSRTARIQNTVNGATMRLLSGACNTLLSTPLIVEVEGRGGQVLKAELFSTGGLLGTSTAGARVVFTVDSAVLGVGRHPLYAILTFAGGVEYRTEALWLRLIEASEKDPPFAVHATSPPARLEWPATAGRSYEVLSQNPTGGFQPVARFTASNSPAWWGLPGVPTGPASSFYRVRTAD